MKNHSPTRPAQVPAAFTLIELLVVLAIIGILAALLMPALSRAQLRAQNIACVSQLRQLGLAVRMYAEDNGQQLPTAEFLPSRPYDPAAPRPRICDVLKGQVGKAAGTNSAPVFRCPSDHFGHFTQEGSSYAWNVELNGQTIDKTSSVPLGLVSISVMNGVTNQSSSVTNLLYPPETSPLLFDYEEYHPRPANKNLEGKNVVFMDGHVSPLNYEEELAWADIFFSPSRQ